MIGGAKIVSQYNIIISTNEETVVTEYEPQVKRSDAYQSEAALEAAFIKMLGEQGYEYVSIHNEEDLVLNLRKQLERLNQYSFTDKQWETFFKSKIANANEGIVEKTRKIQEDYVQNLTCEDGRTQNIYLIDKKNIHNNRLQVINQYEEGGGNHDTRYDVTILEWSPVGSCRTEAPWRCDQGSFQPDQSLSARQLLGRFWTL